MRENDYHSQHIIIITLIIKMSIGVFKKIYGFTLAVIMSYTGLFWVG